MTLYIHMTFREHRKYEWNTPLLSPEMCVTFLTHFRASIYPGKGSPSVLQAVFFRSTNSAFIQNSHLRDARHSQVLCCQPMSTSTEKPQTTQMNIPKLRLAMHIRQWKNCFFEYVYTKKETTYWSISIHFPFVVLCPSSILISNQSHTIKTKGIFHQLNAGLQQKMIKKKKKKSKHQVSRNPLFYNDVPSSHEVKSIIVDHCSLTVASIIE